MKITRRTLLVSTAAGIISPRRLLDLASPLSLGEAADLAVLHTNDIHGRVDVQGEKGLQGLACVAREIRRQRAAYASSLTLDAGDIIHGTPMEQRVGPAPVIEAFNAVGYEAATAGNHEFDFGPENCRHAARLARFPILSANVKTPDGDPWGPVVPSRIFQKAGRRIAVFGLTTLETPKIQWPRTIEGIRFTDPFEAARKQAEALRSKADLLICLSHLGVDQDRKLAHECPGLDLIVGGHSHTRLDEADVQNGVPIVQTGAYGRALGVVEIRFEGARPRISSRLIDAAPPKDDQVDRVYGPHKARLDRDLAEVLCTLSHDLDFTGLKEARSETGRLLAECVRSSHKTEVGLFSSSQISGAIKAGPVARRDVYAVMGSYTRQHVVKIRAPRELVAAALAKAKASVQVSGEGSLVAGPAHVIQDLFLGKQGVEILYDDPLGPGVRDAVMEGLQKGIFGRPAEARS